MFSPRKVGIFKKHSVLQDKDFHSFGWPKQNFQYVFQSKMTWD